MKRAHITMVPRILAVMEALAELNGQSVSALVNEAATEYLKLRKLLPEITPEMLREKMAAPQLKGEISPPAARIKTAKARLEKNAAKRKN